MSIIFNGVTLGDELLYYNGVSLSEVYFNSTKVWSQKAPQGYQDFTTSGTFTVPVGITEVKVSICGGGGGGGRGTGSGNDWGGGGGGASACITQTISNLTPEDEIAITIGAGGAGASSNGGNGGTGGASSFGTHIVAIGGTGGTGHGGAGSGVNGGGNGGLAGGDSNPTVDTAAECNGVGCTTGYMGTDGNTVPVSWSGGAGYFPSRKRSAGGGGAGSFGNGAGYYTNSNDFGEGGCGHGENANGKAGYSGWCRVFWY